MYLPKSRIKGIVICPICQNTQNKCKKGSNHSPHAIVLRIYDTVKVADGRIGILIYIGKIDRSTGFMSAIVRITSTEIEDLLVTNIASVKLS